MSDFETQLHTEACKVKMLASEKRELKARVVSFMEYHPRAEKVGAERAQAYIASQPYSLFSIKSRYFGYGFGVVALLVFVVLPTVAERAVPGDVLYPIKVNVNEEIRGTLAFSTTEKIEWETERMERRIAEVRLLASEGKLTDQVEEEAAKAVKAHADAAQDGINKLRETDADEATFAEVAFTSALAVQSYVLDADQHTSSSSAAATDELVTIVKAAQETATAAKGTTTPSFAKVSARLEAETTRAYELFASLDDVVNEIERNEIERRLADIERKVERGYAEQEEAEVSAILVSDKLLTALADTRKLISFMSGIDVRDSVSIDTLVPIEMTDAEQHVMVAEQMKIVAATVRAVELALTDADLNAGVREKLVFGQTLLAELSAQYSEAQEDENLELMVEAAVEASEFASDLRMMANIEISDHMFDDGNASSTPVTADTASTTDMGATTTTNRATTTDAEDGTQTAKSTTTTTDTEAGL